MRQKIKLIVSYRNDAEYLALLNISLTSSLNEAPRWISADWIEETGGLRRAKIIREQLSDQQSEIAWTNSLPRFPIPSIHSITEYDYIKKGVLSIWRSVSGERTDVLKGLLDQIDLRIESF